MSMPDLGQQWQLRPDVHVAWEVWRARQALDGVTKEEIGVPEDDGGVPAPDHGAVEHKRGLIIADDVFQAIHHYARIHQLYVKQVIDQVCREFFERHGWPSARTE